MPQRLPPLTSLRAFEAAGRRLSFTRAASDLSVTQAAISHQIKGLEAHLGEALFVRMPRRLELTASGKKLLPVVSEAFSNISSTISQLRQDSGNVTLTIRLAPSFAASWLAPRLEDFRRANPEINLALNHSNEPVDFSREEIDLAITYGDGHWPGTVADEVLKLDFFPVCSPHYMTGDYPLTDIQNIRQHTLLHDADYQNWTDWLKLAGLHDIDPTSGTVIDDTNVLTQTAINGFGIALGSQDLVAEHLAAGRLVKPFETTLRNDFAYYVVCPRTHLESLSVRAFRTWLISQSST